MTFLADVGLLALGSRARALSEQLYTVADEVYRARGAALQARWFPVLRLLAETGPQTVGAIAAAIGQTHSAVSQLADKLVAGDWLAMRTDPADKRRRLLALTPQSEAALAAARPVWRAIEEVLAERCQAAGVDILGALARFEGVVDASLGPAIVARCRQAEEQEARIVPFAPPLREHFYRLNAAWLQKYFYLEEIDHRVLSAPEREILEPGGAIFFALVGDAVVGTCALLRAAAGTYELTKMAVDERYQGRGVGRKLLGAAIAEFERRRGKTLFLESNRRLLPALRLYESMGFVHQPARKPDSHYTRSDVYMIWRAPTRSGRTRRAARSRSTRRSRPA